MLGFLSYLLLSQPVHPLGWIQTALSVHTFLIITAAFSLLLQCVLCLPLFCSEQRPHHFWLAITVSEHNGQIKCQNTGHMMSLYTTAFCEFPHIITGNLKVLTSASKSSAV